MSFCVQGLKLLKKPKNQISFHRHFKLSLFALSQSIRLRTSGITSEIMSFVDFMQLDELVSSAYIVTCPFSIHKGRSFM